MFIVKKISDYTLPRNRVYLVAIFLGVLAGIANSYLDIDFSPRPALLVWTLVSIVIVVVLHEGIHGATAIFLGYKPLFNFKPPLVYITFISKLPRGHFILVALAPLFVLDILFGLLYIQGTFRLFADISLIINTIGAVGDVWIVFKLFKAPKTALVQDTKTGIEVWIDDKE